MLRTLPGRLDRGPRARAPRTRSPTRCATRRSTGSWPAARDRRESAARPAARVDRRPPAVEFGGQRDGRMAARRPGQPVGVRKVRAPQRKVAGNARPPRGEDQRHSDDAGDLDAGVKRGKLYPEQGQIGGRPPGSPGAGALPSPRVGRMSRRATGGPRWMAIAAPLRRCGTELGLQAASLTYAPHHGSPRRRRSGARMFEIQAASGSCIGTAATTGCRCGGPEHDAASHDPERAWLQGRADLPMHAVRGGDRDRAGGSSRPGGRRADPAI